MVFMMTEYFVSLNQPTGSFLYRKMRIGVSMTSVRRKRGPMYLKMLKRMGSFCFKKMTAIDPAALEERLTRNERHRLLENETVLICQRKKRASIIMTIEVMIAEETAVSGVKRFESGTNASAKQKLGVNTIIIRAPRKRDNFIESILET
jgi:hypothetical protein